MNGLYLQLHAYMLRVAIPYGELSYIQLKKLAEISENTTKDMDTLQLDKTFNLIGQSLEDVPKILEELADVEMHAIQTSGNCIRNISCDHLAGINNEEVEDPRPWCEIIRKWSTFHPEFSFLPRKFKIAVIACETDRAAMKVHDIGLKLKKKKMKLVLKFLLVVGQGRSPFIAKKINNFVKKKDLLNYLEAILSIYNEMGRRDNIYKARIKILINELGEKKLKSLVENKFKKFANKKLSLKENEIQEIKNYFKLPIPGPIKSEIPLKKINNTLFG